jgi:hypothetical protein
MESSASTLSIPVNNDDPHPFHLLIFGDVLRQIAAPAGVATPPFNSDLSDP